MASAALTTQARREDEAHSRMLCILDEMRRLRVELARLFATLDDSAHFLFEGAASIAECGERHGIPGREARALADAGRSFAVAPALEEKVLAGRISVEAAGAVGRVLRNPVLQRPGDDWMLWAETLTAREVQQRVRLREEEARIGGPAIPVTVHLSARGKGDFDRSRALLSRKASRAFTEGETVEALADYFLTHEDPLRRRPGKRRVPDTAGRPGRRYVPAEVRREVARRTEDSCAVLRCGHQVFLNNAHRRPHALGGSREERNLLRLCYRHHRMLDSGRMRVRGLSHAPEFVMPDGTVLPARPPP